MLFMSLFDQFSEMGTETHYKNSFSEYYSMRNANEDSNITSWHLFNTLTNNHYNDGFTPKTDKLEVKQKMLQHEAIFKNQVYELHRLYRRQRDLIEEGKIRRNELYKYHVSIDTLSSSSLVASRKPCASFLKDCEVVDCRPSKVRKKLFDLELPAHEYTEPEEGEHIADNSQISAKENGFVTQNEMKDGYLMRSNALADLNEPVYSQDVDFLGQPAKPGNDRNNMNHTSRFNRIPLLFSPFTSTLDMGNSWGPPSFISSHNSHEVFRDKQDKIFKGSSFIDLTRTTKEDDNSRSCKNGDYGGDVASASIEHTEIDINVAWDDDMDKQIGVKKEAVIKNNFDLNSCVTEDDELLVTESYKSSKKKMEIDLEAPAVSEIDEDDEHKETELKSNELEKIAAEVIVAISSQQDHVGPVSESANDDDNPLLWFADVINSCEKNIASNTCELDEYEMLTLQLQETKEEDYMPTPLVPENQEPDDVGPEDSRPRRGQGRRGRARRDFQRDILPGITSLSRHEITEDIQIFGGLMRATGHSWNLGPKRSGARGRRKLKAVETALSKQVLGLDERRLTGWGKTTRRPRRQRCAAANSVAVRIM